ncbi:MAG: ZIP family metal transporter [Pseudomonadota bacterium]|nr:ZIP family metal transporter [Pseudomonadota bacterium]
MSTLSWIVVVSFAGGVLSVLCAALFAFAVRPAWMPVLVSYAVGALLGAAFLETLPHAFEHSKDVPAATTTVMLGILFFFVLEKLVLWRHNHAHDFGQGEHHLHDGHDHGRSGLMIIFGDTFHNFVDGILIAAAFMTDVKLGVVTAFAMIAHEIPQEVGDFLVLLHSGYSRTKAFMLNIMSSLATLLGGMLAYFALQSMQGMVPTLLAFAAASMIYVAVADLIPGLHRRSELTATAQQILLIALGIGTVYLSHELLDHFV